MEEDYGAETMNAADPSSMAFDVLGNAVTDDTPGNSTRVQMDGSGTQIDYSNVPPVQFQKTATLLNYFITNTAQFLNTFSQVAETKLHEVDERLDEIEQILAIYESKLDLPEEFFEDMPDMPAPEVQQQELIARTENPLQNANQKVDAAKGSTRAKTEKAKAGAANGTPGAPEKKSYVPPPPPDGAKIPPPSGMPAVKTFPASTGPPPKGMSFPGIAEASEENKQPQENGAGGDAPAEEEEEVDDGFTPEQRRKNALEQDAGFKKYLMMYRMKIPLVNIRNKIIAEGTFTKDDIDLFADQQEIDDANNSLQQHII